MIKKSLFLISLCVPILSGCNTSKHSYHAMDHHKNSNVVEVERSHKVIRRHEPLITPYPGPLVSSDSPKLTHNYKHKHRHKHKKHIREINEQQPDYYTQH